MLLELHDIVLFRQIDPKLFGMFGGKAIRALDGVSLALEQGETLGVMGGSGSGKTSLAEVATLRLPVSRGHVAVNGQNAGKLSSEQRKSLRRRLALVRQDARESLDLEHSIRVQFTELLRHSNLQASDSKVAAALEQVGLSAELLNRTPAELSGGQQQRLAIARALVVNPLLIAGDEPVSGVDPHTQLEILRLLERVQRQQNIAILLVSQDSRVIGRLARRVALLYGGRLCEVGPAEAILTAARHPYSQQFLGQEPGPVSADEDPTERSATGCAWAGRCPAVTETCRRQAPEFREIAPGHGAACHVI